MPFVTSNDIEIYYEVRGEGPAVVLLHSFFCSGKMWRHQVKALSKNWRTINIDLRGHGRSGRILKPFALNDLVDDVTAVMDDIEVEKAVWAGLSIGGMTALLAALKVPERIAGMILLDTDGDSENGLMKLKSRSMALIARLFGVKPLLSEMCRIMFGATTRAEDPELVAEWRKEFSTVDAESAIRVVGALVRRRNLLPRLGDVDIPALVLVGTHDTALPPERSQAIAAALPTATYREIDGAGHLTALEKPNIVTGLMKNFLESDIPV